VVSVAAKTTEFPWSRPRFKGEPPSPRGGHSATVAGNSLFVFGGCHLDAACYNDMYAYNTNQSTWDAIPLKDVVPAERGRHTATLFGKDEIYIIAGLSNSGFRNDVFIFNTESKTFTLPAVSEPGPTPRAGHSAAVWGHNIYIFGGNSEEGILNDLWQLDTRILTWTQIQASGYVAPNVTGHSATVVGDLMYVFGGRNDDGVYGDVYVFDFVTRSWKKPFLQGKPPAPRHGHIAALHDGNIFIFGGCDITSHKCYNKLQVLDTKRHRWARHSTPTSKKTPDGFISDKEDPVFLQLDFAVLQPRQQPKPKKLVKVASPWFADGAFVEEDFLKETDDNGSYYYEDDSAPAPAPTAGMTDDIDVLAAQAEKKMRKARSSFVEPAATSTTTTSSSTPAPASTSAPAPAATTKPVTTSTTSTPAKTTAAPAPSTTSSTTPSAPAATTTAAVNTTKPIVIALGNTTSSSSSSPSSPKKPVVVDPSHVPPKAAPSTLPSFHEPFTPPRVQNVAGGFFPTLDGEDLVLFGGCFLLDSCNNNLYKLSVPSDAKFEMSLFLEESDKKLH